MKIIQQFIALFFISRWLLLPLLVGVLVILDALLKKAKLKEAGSVIVKLNNIYHFRVSTYITIGMFVLALLLILALPTDYLTYMYILVICIASFSTDFSAYRYSKINGLYENGLIINKLYKWKDLHSWTIIENKTISILDKNGCRFDIDNINGIAEHLRSKVARQDISK